MSEARDDDPGGFLTRWSRRKVQVRQGEAVAEPPPPVPQPAVPALAGRSGQAATSARPVAGAPAVTLAEPTGLPTTTRAQPPVDRPAAEPVAPPAPTLADVAALGRDSDYSRFVTPGVDAGVRNAALQKLFTDPHFNIMDGLDTYIEDYGLPDPLPKSMLRQMVQSHALGLFDDEKTRQTPVPDADARSATDAATPPAATDTPLEHHTHEDADLRLQPDDAAGPAGPGAGPEPDARRQP